MQISAGGGHTCALFDDGNVKCWGQNTAGQLGQGNEARLGAEPDETPDNLPSIDLGTGRTATHISAGLNHTCAVLDDGNVKCWGSNAFGQLGLGHTQDIGDEKGEMGDSLVAVDLGTRRTAKQVALGSFHTCAILTTSQVKCWGRNSFGQLGLGHTADLGDGPDEMGDNLPVLKLDKGAVVQMALGREHTCAVFNNQLLKCWGYNRFGQLGLGHISNVGDDPGEMNSFRNALDLGPERTVDQLVAGSEHTCVVLDNGGVKCWGRGQEGQLGQGDNKDRGTRQSNVSEGISYLDLGETDLKRNEPGFGDLDFRIATKLITAGKEHTCAALHDNKVKCWGSNGQGQLGQGHTRTVGLLPTDMGEDLEHVPLGTNPPPVQLTAGQSHSCALMASGAIRCWGNNGDGQLGLGHSRSIGDEPGEIAIIQPSYRADPNIAPIVSAPPRDRSDDDN